MEEQDVSLAQAEQQNSKNFTYNLKNNKFVCFYLKHRLWINIGIVSLLLLANCFASWMTYITFPILDLMMLADNLENGLSYIMFGLPFCLVDPLASAIAFLCGVVLYVIKFYLIYFIKDKGKLNWKHLIFVGLFILYAVLPIGTYSFATFYKLGAILAIYVALFAMAKKWKVFRMDLNIKIIAGATLLSFLYGLFVFVSPHLQSFIGLPVPNVLYRFQALTLNANMIALLCDLVLAILAYQIVKNKGGYVDLTLFCCVTFAGVFTFSKLYLITLFIIICSLFVGMMFVNWKKTLIFGASIGILLAVIVVAVYFAKPSFFKSVLARFGDFQGSFDDVLNKFTTGRWTLWKLTFTCWGTNPLFFFLGRGLGAPCVPGADVSAHNFFISLIDQLGVVGSILFIIPLVLLFKDIAKNEDTKISKAIIIPILAILMIFMAEDTFLFTSAIL